MNTTTQPARKPVYRNGRLACSNCAFSPAMPAVGLYGHRTSKSRVATWRGWFGRHNCALHPLPA